MGNTIYQYNGSACSHDEKFKAAAEINRLKDSRGKARVETLEENSVSPDHPFMAALKDGTSKPKTDVEGEKKMMKVSDADGSLDMEVLEGVSKDMLTSDDVFIINTGSHVYAWIGSGASIDERKNALSYASNYLNKTETPWLPISVVAQGKENEEFNEAF
jgi:gelsolin